jgi:hypothetical protein
MKERNKKQEASHKLQASSHKENSIEPSALSIQSTRRNFLRNAALAAAGFYIVPRHVLGRGFTAPSDK